MLFFFLLLYNVQKLNKILFLFLLHQRMHACMVATMMIKNADNKVVENSKSENKIVYLIKKKVII